MSEADAGLFVSDFASRKEGSVGRSVGRGGESDDKIGTMLLVASWREGDRVANGKWEEVGSRNIALSSNCAKVGDITVGNVSRRWVVRSCKREEHSCRVFRMRSRKDWRTEFDMRSKGRERGRARNRRDTGCTRAA